MQTRLGSFVEAWANIGVGFGINYAGNILIFPLFGYFITYSEAFWIGVIFTVISLVRSYVIRRWFNGFKWGNHERQSEAHPANEGRQGPVRADSVRASGCGCSCDGERCGQVRQE